MPSQLSAQMRPPYASTSRRVMHNQSANPGIAILAYLASMAMRYVPVPPDVYGWIEVLFFIGSGYSGLATVIQTKDLPTVPRIVVQPGIAPIDHPDDEVPF